MTLLKIILGKHFELQRYVRMNRIIMIISANTIGNITLRIGLK